MNDIDMSQFTQPKSDQLNTDDLIGGPLTITITRVTANEGNAEQPINVFFEGDNGKPFRPCKSMRRVMMGVWGRRASGYIGKSMTLYRDPKVQWGGMEVGGIRISHMTDLEQKKVMALTASNRARKPYTVLPLTDVPAQQQTGSREAADKIIANIGRAPSADKLDQYLNGKKVAAAIASLGELAAEVNAAAERRREELSPSPGADEEDPFADPELEAAE